MKKATTCLIWFLFALTILYPTGAMIAAGFEYSFELKCVLAISVIIALLALCTVIFALVFENIHESAPIRVILALLAPLSLLNAVLYISKCPKIIVAVSAFVSAGCCSILTEKYGKPLALKHLTLTLSVLTVIPIFCFTFFSLIFGNLGEDTIIQTVESPSETYYAQVIDCDQGALGGATLVNVFENKGMDAILFKIEKIPQRVYVGPWGEFNSMEIYWKDDSCLVINSAEYEIL